MSGGGATAGSAGGDEMVGVGQPRLRAGIYRDGYRGGGGKGGQRGEGGEAGNGGVGGNWDGNWDIEDMQHINTFKRQSLVSSLPMLRDGTSPPDYGHALGTRRPF